MGGGTRLRPGVYPRLFWLGFHAASIGVTLLPGPEAQPVFLQFQGTCHWAQFRDSLEPSFQSFTFLEARRPPRGPAPAPAPAEFPVAGAAQRPHRSRSPLSATPTPAPSASVSPREQRVVSQGLPRLPVPLGVWETQGGGPDEWGSRWGRWRLSRPEAPGGPSARDHRPTRPRRAPAPPGPRHPRDSRLPAPLGAPALPLAAAARPRSVPGSSAAQLT